jgi:CubicO group peptidase (beta-lactamase class C family)
MFSVGSRFIVADSLCDDAPEAATAVDADLQQVKVALSLEIEQLIAATGIPSVSIVLLREDQVIWSEAKGFMNVRLQTPASTETIYCTGSCFKPITAMAVMQLVDEGLVDLDAPVNDYLGEHRIDDLTDAGTPVTLRHLLSHYSGLPTEKFEALPLWNRTQPRSLEELAADLQIESPPGMQFEYSNAGYALAGLVIEQVSGLSYEEYIVQKILTPAGVEITAPVNPTPDMLERLAMPYRVEANAAVPEAWHRFDVYPAGELYLTAHDMGKVLLTHLNGGRSGDVSILSEESVIEMRTPQFGGETGLDFGIRRLEEDTLISHGGGVPGYSTMFILDVESRIGVYVACNAGQAQMATDYLAQLSIDLLLGKEIGTGLVREIVGVGTALAADEDSGLIRITDVFLRSPAQVAGITRGQLIQEINGQSVAGKSLMECLELMAGPSGTNVRLTILGSDAQESQTYDLIKGSFRIPG